MFEQSRRRLCLSTTQRQWLFQTVFFSLLLTFFTARTFHNFLRFLSSVDISLSKNICYYYFRWFGLYSADVCLMRDAPMSTFQFTSPHLNLFCNSWVCNVFKYTHSHIFYRPVFNKKLDRGLNLLHTGKKKLSKRNGIQKQPKNWNHT